MAGIATAARARAVSFELKTVLFLGVVVVLGFSVLYPFILLLINSFTVTRFYEPARYGFAAWEFALSDPGMLKALLHTFYLMVVLQAISFPVAILLCWLIARTDMPGAKWLEFLFWLAFFMPVIPAVQAWILLADPFAGLINEAIRGLPFIDFEKGPINIYSFWGIVWVHLATNAIALKVMLLAPAFRSLDATLEDASRISGAGSMRTLLRVTVPVLTPAIFTIMMLSILRDAQTVEIEVLLGTQIHFFVFGSKVIRLGSSSSAAAMGITILLAITPLVIFHMWYTRRRVFATLTSQYQPHVFHLRQWRWPAFSLVLVVASLMTFVPFTFLLMGTFMKLFGWFNVPTGAWTLDNWERVITDTVFTRSIRNTLYLGLGAATVSAVLFTLLAYIIVRVRTRLRLVIEFFVWVPYVMPGVILALAWLIIMLKTPFLRPLYGSMLLLILVSGLSGITIGVQLIKANLMQQGTELEEASTITGAGWVTTFTRVVVPLLAPMIGVVWVLSFVIAVGGAIIPSFLATPFTRPLALLQFEHVNSGQVEEATVVGVILFLFTVGVAIAARAAGFRFGLERSSV